MHTTRGLHGTAAPPSRLIADPVQQLLRLGPDLFVWVVLVHGGLPPARALGFGALGLVNVSAPLAVDASVARLEHDLELGLADEERAQEGERAKLARRWPVEAAREQPLRERERARRRRQRARREEDGRERAEEQVRFRLGHLGREPARLGHDDVAAEVGRFLERRRQREREHQRVQRRDKVAEVDVERFAWWEQALVRNSTSKPEEGRTLALKQLERGDDAEKLLAEIGRAHV